MESIRQEFGRDLGKIVTPLLKRRVDKENPDIVVMVNPYNQKVTLQVNPVFIKGRYKKLVRGIPQSHWHCRTCKGRGCEKCNFTGKQYQTSVEEIIAEPFMEVMKGSSEALHGVITSYSIHYTKLYDIDTDLAVFKKTGKIATVSTIFGVLVPLVMGYLALQFMGYSNTEAFVGGVVLTATSIGITVRITSYNVCYTKLLRERLILVLEAKYFELKK